MKAKPNNEWEKEFEKRFGYWFKDPMNENLDKGGKLGLKFFISKTLQQQREEIIKEIEGITDNFPKLIKDTRKGLGENQTKFGARFGLAHNTISYIEQGKFESPWSVISFCQRERLKQIIN